MRPQVGEHCVKDTKEEEVLMVAHSTGRDPRMGMLADHRVQSLSLERQPTTGFPKIMKIHANILHIKSTRIVLIILKIYTNNNT